MSGLDLDDIVNDAEAVYTEYWTTDPDDQLSPEEGEFLTDFVHTIIANTLDWAAKDMRRHGPTIAAIHLEQRAEEVRRTNT